MIILLGVGHVFDIAETVRRIIEAEHPDVVCVELDPARYQALLHPGGRTEARLTYRLLATFQKRLASQYGGEVGSEMLAATKTAQEIGADVMLIDADAQRMFRRLYAEMPFPEKARLGLSAVTSIFISSKRVEQELESFQQNEGAYMAEMGEQFPTLKRILLDERNQLMAKRIDSAASRYPVVLAAVGDGHVDGILELLDRDDVKVYRLKDIRDQGNTSTAKPVQSNAQARYHFERSAN
jgi:pheromone shutdown protein TraB